MANVGMSRGGTNMEKNSYLVGSLRKPDLASIHNLVAYNAKMPIYNRAVGVSIQ